MRLFAAITRLRDIALCATLVACSGGQELAGEPGLLPEVKTYYDRNGIEVGGVCRTPEFGGVLRSEVLERSADRLVVRVDYTYNDPNDRLPGQCRGVGTRVFTATRQHGKLEVVEMTGTQNKGIRIERIDETGVW